MRKNQPSQQPKKAEFSIVRSSAAEYLTFTAASGQGGVEAVDDAEHPTHDIGAAGEQEAQRIRDAQHPLAHRLLGKNLVDQQCSTLGHTPGAAAGTETPRSQLKATRCSVWQLSQRTRKKPCSRRRLGTTQQLGYQTLPGEHGDDWGMDGFYFARLRKRA